MRRNEMTQTCKINVLNILLRLSNDPIHHGSLIFRWFVGWLLLFWALLRFLGATYSQAWKHSSRRWRETLSERERESAREKGIERECQVNKWPTRCFKIRKTDSSETILSFTHLPVKSCICKFVFAYGTSERVNGRTLLVPSPSSSSKANKFIGTSFADFDAKKKMFRSFEIEKILHINPLVFFMLIIVHRWTPNGSIWVRQLSTDRNLLLNKAIHVRFSSSHRMLHVFNICADVL